LWNARVLMGSATPSVESYQNALAGKYGLVRLEERYNNVALPGIEYIDLRAFVQQKAPKMILSQPLKEAIEQSLEAKRQVIVFQNRRGYAPYLICRVCGWIPHCNNCDVTLTLHKAKHSMNCHYCGTTYPVVHSCAACGSHDLMQRNFGTEKIEELMAETFPDARIARMDYDSVKGKNDHDALIRLFEQHRIDILVGTQMVVKGLDFQNVNLVCIPDGDSLLHFTDFRVNERAYQLMEQVSGRAGRSDGNGRMMVQVTNPYHPVLQHVQQHDYANMYREEMAMRNQFFYPPFSRLILVTFKHRENHIAEEAANLLVQGMHASFHPYITGPAVPVVNRLRNQYLWEVLFKLPKDAALIQQCKQALLQQYALLQNNQRYRGVRLVFDVDPV
jgi:primosomal protein N' (replication factor Y)